MNAPIRDQETPPKPATFNGDLANLPDVFKLYQERKVWLCWKWTWNGRKWTKPPSTSRGYNASSTNPATWCSYAEALAAVQARQVDGIGIALAGLDGGEIALDLDDCRDAVSGEIAPWAKELVIEAASYTEVTVSGTGLRILGHGNVGRAHTSFTLDIGALEIFTAGEGRYITVSGLELPDCWPHFADIGAVTARLLANKGRLDAAGQEEPQQQKEEPKKEEPQPGQKSGTGSEFFRNVNSAALAHLKSWVLEILPKAKFYPGQNSWRVASKDLNRDFEEDLSIHPHGITDWGPRKNLTAIDLVIEFGGAADAVQAALWLCKQCNLDPAILGWKSGNADGQRKTADDPKPATQHVWNPWREVSAPSFPLDVLPDDVAQYVEARGIETGACRSAIAMSCLAVASGAVSHEARLYLKPGKNFAVSPRLWVLLVGDPSAKKSPAMDGAAKPLLARQKAEHTAAMAAYREKVEAAEGKAKKDVPKPDLTHYLVNDLTPEMLAEVLSRQDRGTLVMADELAGWLGAFDRYASGKGASSSRAIWLQAYNGGPYSLLRVTRETLPVNNLSASLLGGIQPERLREIGGFTSDGLLQRFLPVMMAKPDLDRDTFNSTAFRGWDERVQSLLGYSRFSTELGSEAREERRRIAEVLFDLGQSDTEGAGWQGFVGKLPGVWGALALLLHVLWGNRAADPVTLETARLASRLIEEFILPHGLGFYRNLLGTGQAEARSIAGFLAGWDQPTIAVRDFTRGPGCCRGVSPEDIVLKLAPFEAGGWLDPEKPGPWNRKWTVVPGLATRFGRELARHREAVAKVQAKISGGYDDE